MRGRTGEQTSDQANGPPPVVEASGLTKWYGDVLGVRDLGFRLGRGVIGLLGPNGAGKSTLLRLLAGVLRPSAGECRVLGMAPAWCPQAYLRIGYAPESDGLYEDLTACEFLVWMLRLQGLVPVEAAALALASLAQVDLAADAGRRLGGFSKGMRQRVKLAQALAHDPELLLLDEPLNGCDPLNRIRIIDLVRDLGQRGRTVLVSSHVLHEVEAMTSEILLMARGQLLAEGNIYRLRELIDAHPHRIRIDSDRPRELGAELLRAPHVLGVTLGEVGHGGGRLEVRSRQPDACYDDIPLAARRAAATVSRLESEDNNLAAVFRYLTQGSANVEET